MIVLITGGGLRSRQIWERCEMVCKGKIWDTEIRRVQRRWIENVQRLRERKVVEKIKWTRWDKIVRSLLSYEKWFYTNKAFIILFFGGDRTPVLISIFPIKFIRLLVLCVHETYVVILDISIEKYPSCRFHFSDNLPRAKNFTRMDRDNVNKIRQI